MEELRLAHDENQVVCGTSHTFLRRENGTIAVCGRIPLDYRDRFTALATAAPVAQVASGCDYTFLRYYDGTTAACGNGHSGQLGLGHNATTFCFTPVETPLPVVSVACGSNFTFLLYEDGTIAACGRNSHGQLGLPGDRRHDRFTAVPVRSAVTQVSCGALHTFLLLEDGRIASCGANYSGQLGGNHLILGDGCFLFPPVASPVAEVACGEFHTFLLYDNGSVASCGWNVRGQLGLGDTAYRLVFTPVPALARVVQVASGASHVVLRFEDGSVAACGWNESGQLGLGGCAGYYDNRDRFETVAVGRRVSRVATGDSYTFLQYEDGSIASCGNNSKGQLGLGDNVNRNRFSPLK